MRSRSNLAASISARLNHLSRERRIDHQRTLAQFGAERLLYRLGQSPYRDRFVLKGGMLFYLWSDAMPRATKDIDFLGCGGPWSDAEVRAVFEELCRLPVPEAPDGLEFRPESIEVADIREGREAGGKRVTMLAMLGKSKLVLQIDIGFGDAITPGYVEAEFPVLLDLPAPAIRHYPPETVVAEKWEAIIQLDLVNSRLKDFFDLWAWGHRFEFEGGVLVAAITATFQRRGTVLPNAPPPALTEAFTGRPATRAQWAAFIGRTSLRADQQPGSLEEVIAFLRGFLLEPTFAAARGEPLHRHWPRGGPWEG